MFRNQRLIETSLTTNSSNGVGGYKPYCNITQWGIGVQYISQYNYIYNGTWTYVPDVKYAIYSDLYVPSANNLAPSNIDYDINIDDATVKSNRLYIIVTIDIQNTNEIINYIRNNAGLTWFYTRIHVPNLEWKLYRV